MKTKKMKLSFNKSTVVDLNKVNGGKVFIVPKTMAETCLTNCDRDTDCYDVSRCMTVCGGPYC